MEELLRYISLLSLPVAAFWALYVYHKQQKFKRLQNLAQVFQRFADNDEFLEIFDLCDQPDLDTLAQLSSKKKLKYLALLEEVAVYSSYSEIDKRYAVHMFQWHFYYVYNDKQVAQAFWSNLGGIAEKDKPYWQHQNDFAKSCNPE